MRIAARVVYERAFVDGGDFGFVFSFYVLFCFVFCVKAGVAALVVCERAFVDGGAKKSWTESDRQGFGQKAFFI